MLRPLLHLILHAVVPGLAAHLGWRKRRLHAWVIMLLTNLIDLDHLLADQIYDANRCSIGFHPLHSYAAIALFALTVVPSKTRLIGVGLMIHIALDALDCWWMTV